ncbi:sulfotransferase [Hydrogenimonas thermophila]|uniref:sulfotransferase n=1 Tax=Hydrogenimonas thermophila TaxID=223786 RepID=UPI002936ED67|nr:sulfotransferase [Hydrogenimonas thermophila]WOE70347.1 sulfotransferase [Hydrogenimonas thermophila]WOE72864.1 sulfotransferase [Hydrogenimonas thermophila]
MTEYFFHIGLPKSATSYLQKNFFPVLNLTYLGKHYDSKIDKRDNNKDFEKLFRALFYKQPFQVTEEEYNKIKNLIGHNKKILYSNEVMVGSYTINFNNGYQIAHHIKNGFPNSKIIYVIRKQDDFIESLYRQAIRNGYSHSIKKFLNYKKGSFRINNYENDGQIDLFSLDYYKQLTFYTNIFGKENLLVLPYELLKINRTLFLKKLTSFMSVEYIEPLSSEKTNSQDGYILLLIMRFINSFISKKIQNRLNDVLFFNKIGKLLNYIPYKRKFISYELQKKIQEFYNESNKKASEKFHLELENFGYIK